MNKLLFVASGVFISMGTFAGTRTWTGLGGDSLWTNKENWSGSTLPSWGDKIVFDKPGSTYVSTDGVSTWIRYIDVLQGDVYIGSTAQKAFYFHGTATGDHVTNTVFVAAGSTLVVSNSINNYSGAGAAFLKTGGGVLSMRNRIDGGSVKTCSFDSEHRFATVDIAGGGISNIYHSSTYYGVYFRPRNVIVRDGAWLYHKGYASLDDQAVYTLEKNARLVLHMSESTDGCTIAGLRGEGTVEATSGGPLYLTLLGGPYSFSGTVKSPVSLAFSNKYGVSEEAFRLELGAADVTAGTTVQGLKALSFAPDIGSFGLGRLRPSVAETLLLEDTDGQPVTVRAQVEDGYAAKVLLSGRGTFVPTESLTAKGDMLDDFKGTVVAPSGKTVTFGTGTVADDVDLSSLVRVEAVGPVIYKNAGDSVQNGALTGNGSVTVKGPGGVTLADVQRGPGASALVSDSLLTILSGEVDSGYWGLTSENGGGFVVKGGRLHNGATVNGFGTDPSVLKTPDGFRVTNSAGGKLRVEGGEVFLSADDPGGFDALELTGGETVMIRSYKAAGGATAENPSRVIFDGGTLVCSCKSPYYYECRPFAANAAIDYRVGTKGATVDVRDAFTSEQSIYFEPMLANGVVDGTDGGFTRYGTGTFVFNCPMSLAGACRLLDGWNTVPSGADVAGHPSYFGTGDFVLGNAQLTLVSRSGRESLSLGGSGNSTLVCTGAATLRNESAAGWDVTFGALTRECGGVLIIKDNKFGGVTPSHYLVRGGVTTNACGLVTFPVALASGSYNRLLTYDATRGLAFFDNYVSFKSAQAGDVVKFPAGETTWVAAGAEKSVLAIETVEYAGIGINPGGVLHVGNGVDPALVLFNAYSWFSGTGTLDFGTSEGVIVFMGRSNKETPDLPLTVSGSKGLSLVADAGTNHAGVRLMAANSFTGGLTVNGLAAVAVAADCLGNGKVTVGGGDMNGGRIVFAAAIPYSNDFDISGRGPTHSGDGSAHGALSFSASATLTGNVAIDRSARVSAYSAGVRATLSGIVSGGRLEVYDGAGVLCLSGVNTYTGGTTVLKSTLALADAGTAGTGGIVLDNGTLRIENESPKTVVNVVSGIGTLQLAGKGEVTFAELQAESGAGIALDLARKVTTVTSLNGISSITTDRTHPTHLIVMDGSEATFAGDVPANVTLHARKYENRDGLMLIVR